MSLLTIARSHLQLVANSRLLAITTDSLFKLLPLAKTLVTNYWIKTSIYGAYLGTFIAIGYNAFVIYNMATTGNLTMMELNLSIGTVQIGTKANSLLEYIVSSTIPITIAVTGTIGATLGPYIPPMLGYLAYLAWDIYTERSMKQEYKAHIDSLIHSNFNEEKPDSCPICFEDLLEADRQLSCGHYIHRSCFIQGSKVECPMCRTPVHVTYEEYKAIVDKEEQILQTTNTQTTNTQTTNTQTTNTQKTNRYIPLLLRNRQFRPVPVSIPSDYVSVGLCRF